MSTAVVQHTVTIIIINIIIIIPARLVVSNVINVTIRDMKSSQLIKNISHTSGSIELQKQANDDSNMSNHTSNDSNSGFVHHSNNQQQAWAPDISHVVVRS